MILSHLDHFNAIFYNLPAFLERKLTKVLYAAVCFVFNMRLSRNRCHNPDWKKCRLLRPRKIFPFRLQSAQFLHQKCKITRIARDNNTAEKSVLTNSKPYYNQTSNQRKFGDIMNSATAT